MGNPLINHVRIRRLILDLCERRLPGRFQRVSRQAIEHYEARLRAWIEHDVQTHPSIGRTFRP